MTRDLHDARLDFELVAAQLERALGSGGAPERLDVARQKIAAVDAALTQLRAVLGREMGDG